MELEAHIHIINHFRIEIPALQSIVIANRALFQWLSIGLSMHILFVVVMRAV
jgi:hypothetical protein